MCETSLYLSFCWFIINNNKNILRLIGISNLFCRATQFFHMVGFFNGDPTRHVTPYHDDVCHTTPRHDDVLVTKLTDIVEVPPVGYQGTMSSLNIPMDIRWLPSALVRSDHPLHRLLSEFYDHPSSEIHTRRFNPFSTSSIFWFEPPSFDTYTPVTLLGSSRFHGESLDQTQEPVFLRVNHTDSLLGHPFISESVQSGNLPFVGAPMNPWPLLCIGWEWPLHDEVNETWAVVHDKLLWSWHRGASFSE